MIYLPRLTTQDATSVLDPVLIWIRQNFASIDEVTVDGASADHDRARHSYNRRIAP